MAEIIKQPNGKYLLYSTIVDDITHINMSAEDIVNLWIGEARIEINEKVDRIVSQLNEGKKPYYQFTTSYEKALESIKDIHGEEHYGKVRLLIEESVN